jgi:hypothetical protein
MSIPKQTLTVRDPGLGLAAATINSFLYMGCAQKGTVNTVFAFADFAAVVDTFGQGPLSEDLCYHLAIAGAPVYGMRLPHATAGAAGAVTKVFATDAVGTGTITVAAATPPAGSAAGAWDAYEFVGVIRLTGTSGAGEFAYSLDGGHVFSPQLVIPSGGTYTIPNTNLTITFVPGSGTSGVFFNVGDTHTFSSTGPIFTATELAAGITALLTTNVDLAAIILSGKNATASAAALLAAALSVHGQSMFNQFRYVRTMLDAGGDVPATTITAFAAIADARVSPVYGDGYVISAKPFAGFAASRRPGAQVLAARCADILPSTDPARNAEGPLQGVVRIFHDEFRTELMDQRKFSTLRTWQGNAGFYPTNCRLMSPAGSDFEFWQHGRLMDIACDVVAKAQMPFMSSSVRVNANGTISDEDATRWETAVNGALRAALMDPDNAEGTKGHVSAFSYVVDRTTNVLTSKRVKTKVAIRPLGYAKDIATELGFSANV